MNRIKTQMCGLGLFILFGLCIGGVPAPSTFCYDCQHVDSPEQCTFIHKCHGDQMCGTEAVDAHGGHVEFNLGCFDHHECPADGLIIGRRGGHHVHCRKCCPGNNCNRNLCSEHQIISPTQAPIQTESSSTCLSCKQVSHPADCWDTKICHPDEQCGTEAIVAHDGRLEYHLDCFKQHDCDHQIFNDWHHDSHHPICKLCCNTARCNQHMCAPAVATQPSTTQGHVTGSSQSPISSSGPPINLATTTRKQDVTYVLITTSNPGPTTTTSAAPTTTEAEATTTSDADCVDFEEHGFVCSSFDQLNFCTDTTSFAYATAQTRCRAHCGFCGKGANVVNPEGTPETPSEDAGFTVTSSTGLHFTGAECVDDTLGGFVCSDYDMYDFCTDETSWAYALAVSRCPKHCEFCTS